MVDPSSLARIARRAAFPLRLALLRLRRRGGAVAVAALGIAAGACALAVTVGGVATVQERALARAVAAIPERDRVLRVTWAGVPPLGAAGGGLAPLDAEARGALARTGSGTGPAAHDAAAAAGDRVLLLRQTRLGSALAGLGAADRLGAWVRLAQGRLPRGACRPERCEVLRVGGRGADPAGTPGLRLVVVGRGALVSDVPFGGALDRAALAPELQRATGYHQAAQPPVLLAGDVAGLAGIELLAPVYRSVTWVVPLPAAAGRPWAVAGFMRAVAQARGRLQTASPLFDLAAPVEQVEAARAATRAAGRRLLLVGGQAAALLLAFALLAATGLRREADATRRRLLWSGARPWQGLALAAAESAAIAVGATAAGWAAGAGVAALVAGAAGGPASGPLRHGLAAGGGPALAGGAAAVAAALLLVALRAPVLRVGALSVTPLDAAAGGAAVTVAVALARGGASPAELAGGGGAGVLVALLPGLVAFAGAVLCARLLPPGLRALERASRGAGPALRLAALSLVRAPGRSAVAVGVLVAATGLGLFALAYRSTLDRHLAAEARAQVPADYVLAESLQRLVPPAAVTSAAALERRLPGIRVAEVVRLAGDVDGLGPQAQAEVLGVPDAALRPRGAGSLALRGVALAPGAATLALPLEVRGAAVRLQAVVRTQAGLFERPAPVVVEPGRRTLALPLPLAARGGLLVQLGLELVTRGTRRGVPGDFYTEEQARGTLRLTGPLAGWVARGDATALGGGRFAFTVGSDAATFLRARQPTDGIALPARATPALARLADADGHLSLSLGERSLELRLAGVVPRVDGVEGDALVVDGMALRTALDADLPGSGTPGELWVDGPAALDAALAAPPLDLLDLSSRRSLEAGLRADPAARGTLIALLAAGLTAMLLALIALGTVLAADLRDERGELFDLEAQGLGPRRLRSHLRLRVGLVAAAGLAGGIALAAVLSALVVRSVAATAGAVAPDPPLGLALAWWQLAVAVGGFAVLAGALAWAGPLGAFRGVAAGRVVEEGA